MLNPLIPSGMVMSFNQTPHDNLECNDYVHLEIIVPVLYLLMFPIALLLNGVAAWISLHFKSTSTFILYLKNLVAADLILTLVIPIKAARDLPYNSKVTSLLSCYVSPILYTTQYTCITFLVLISLDRFLKIMTPRSKLGDLTVSKLLSASVWIILFSTTALPNTILSNESVANWTEISSCMNLKGPAGLDYHEKVIIYQNVFFWLVSVLMAACYICITNKVIQSFRNSGSNNSQGKQKIKLRVFLVVIVFFLSFGPYHIIRIPYTFQQVNESNNDCSFLTSRFAKELSLCFAISNICMNPLLYIFLCREFKEKLMSMIEEVSFLAASAGKSGASSL